MRIAFINSTHKWGGVKTWCIDNAEALTAFGHEVVLYARPGEFLDKARQKGLEAVPHSFGFDFNPASIAYFWREFKKRNIDICVCNVSKDLRSAGIAAEHSHRTASWGDLRSEEIIQDICRSQTFISPLHHSLGICGIISYRTFPLASAVRSEVHSPRSAY